MKRSNRHWQSTSEDLYDQINDPGVYYVYENGQLQSPPGYGKSGRYSIGRSCTDKNPFSMSKVSCYTVSCSGTDRIYQPIKLLDICFEFVAKHIEYVDSLEGFPELIGEQLFQGAVKHGRLKELNSRSVNILKVFSEAYDNLLLDRLTFKNCGLKLDSFVEAIEVCFGHLTVLDLHGCRIGDSHEMIDLIGRFTSLQQLGLCHNALSDNGIQKMTSPMRMFQRGPVALEMLDLSCNPQITDNAARYIVAYIHLSALDLSGTSVKVQGLKKLEANTTLKLVAHCDTSTAMSDQLGGHCISGWASEVVQTWLSDKRAKCGSTENSHTKQFYSRKKIREELAAELKKRTEKHGNTPPRKPVLIFRAKSGDRQQCTNLAVNITSSQRNGKKTDFTGNGHCTGSILQESHANPLLCTYSQAKRDNHVLSPKSPHAKRAKQKVTLASAIEMLTEEKSTSSGSETVLEARKSSQKRKISSDSDEFFGSKKRHYSIEEQDLIGQYFAPNTPSQTASSLIDAMLTPGWSH